MSRAIRTFVVLTQTLKLIPDVETDSELGNRSDADTGPDVETDSNAGTLF